jgi:hypothetical protein
MQINYWKRLFKAAGIGMLMLAAVVPGKAEDSKKFFMLTDKITDRDLSFCVSFDKFSTSADMAAGDPSSTTFKDNLEFRGFSGYDGKNAFLRKGIDELMRYDVDKNVNYRQGTATFWISGIDYSPKDVKMNDAIQTHKPYLFLRFCNGKEWQNIFFYQYYQNPVVYLYWQNSVCKPSMYKLAGAGLSFTKGEWFQVAGSWDEKEIKIYLNGELFVTTALAKDNLLPANFMPAAKQSWIGIRESMWGAGGSDPSTQTAFDDLKIYSRALTAAEIRNQYLKAASVLKNAPKKELTYIDIELNGVDDGKGQLDRLSATVDFAPMDDKWQSEIKAGKTNAEYVLLSPSGKTIKETWNPKEIKSARIIDGVNEPGEYAFTINIANSSGEKMSVTKKIIRPDTAWYGNKIGLEDAVPAPWTPMELTGDNVVKIWNREYCFGNNPLPQKIIDGGESILDKAPELAVTTPEGKSDIKWDVTSKELSQNKTSVTLKGTGKAKTFSINWTTRIEFDGMIRWDYAILGRPEVKSMKLEWTVNRKFSQFTMHPLLKLSGNGKYESPFPFDSRKSATVLWLTSEEKGFCWAPENDANWIYSKDENVIKAIVTDRGGNCEVNMITRAVTIPENTAYHAMFIATPSRPLPQLSRTFRIGGYNRYPNCDVALVQHVGEGYESCFTMKLSPYFGQVMDDLKKNGMKRVIPYGAATFCNSYDKAGNYFQKYWNVTGEIIGGGYPIRPTGKITPDEKESPITRADPRTGYSDYILWNTSEALNHPKQLYVGLYYDISDNQISANELNGASFTDNFGRRINSLIIMGLRRHMLRTYRLAHQHNGVTIYHAHSFYNPMIHDFGDYWFPGEQYCSLMQEKRTPYYYFDHITRDEYRSELNMRLKGSGILFLGNLGRANPAWGGSMSKPQGDAGTGEEYTKAMCTKLLLNDVPLTIAYEEGNVISKIWGAAMRYKLDTATVSFYDQQKEIGVEPASKAGVTYYKCPDGRFLAIIGNLTAEPQTVTIDISKLKTGLSKVRDEYDEQDVPVSGAKFTVLLPARHFKLIGF